MRCADCKHFVLRGSPQDVNTYVADDPPFGRCIRWHAGYRLPDDGLQLNEAWVENDEGWANVVGPEFGCVLFEAAP